MKFQFNKFFLRLVKLHYASGYLVPMQNDLFSPTDCRCGPKRFRTTLICILYCLEQCVCLTNFIWHTVLNPKCHVMFSKIKMNINWHLPFFLKCHFNVTRLVVRVISISKVSIDVWFFFLHKSHYMSKSTLCVSIDVHFIFMQVFVCQMSKICKNFVTNTHWSWNAYETCHNFWDRRVGMVLISTSPEHYTKAFDTPI